MWATQHWLIKKAASLHVNVFWRPFKVIYNEVSIFLPWCTGENVGGISSAGHLGPKCLSTI